MSLWLSIICRTARSTRSNSQPASSAKSIFDPIDQSDSTRGPSSNGWTPAPSANSTTSQRVGWKMAGSRIGVMRARTTRTAMAYSTQWIRKAATTDSAMETAASDVMLVRLISGMKQATPLPANCFAGAA